MWRGRCLHAQLRVKLSRVPAGPIVFTGHGEGEGLAPLPFWILSSSVTKHNKFTRVRGEKEKRGLFHWKQQLLEEESGKIPDPLMHPSQAPGTQYGNMVQLNVAAHRAHTAKKHLGSVLLPHYVAHVIRQDASANRNES